MINTLLVSNYGELIARCIEKTANRPTRNAAAEQLRHGFPTSLE